jgi:hypothetical protein
LKRISTIHLAVYLFYVGVAILITWPLVTVMSTHLVGLADRDATEVARQVWWVKYALQHGEPILSQPFLGYPDGISGAWLWANPLRIFPAWLFAFVMPLPAAYNLAALTLLALNGWAMYWVVWKLTGQQRAPALVAGLVFISCPMVQVKLAVAHAAVLTLWAIPFYGYCLLRLRESRNVKWILPAGLCFFLAPLGHTFQLIYLVMPVSVIFVATLLIRRDWAVLRWFAGVVALGTMLLLPFVLPLAGDAQAYVPDPFDSSAVTFSADLLSIVSPSVFHPLFRHLSYSQSVLGPYAERSSQAAAYIGIVAGCLAAVGVWRFREARFWLGIGLLAWVFSLGPLLQIAGGPVAIRFGAFETYITLPWALFQNLPLVNISRAPGRFNYTVAVVVAVLAGYGMVYLWQKSARWRIAGTSPRYAILLTIMAVILWEYQFFWPMPVIEGRIPAPIAALARRDDIRAIMDIPWQHAVSDKHALYLQTGHEHPIIAGHIARETTIDPARPSVLESTLDPALLDLAGVDVVILHKTYDNEDTLDALARQQLGEPFYEDDQIAAFEVPAPTGEPVFTAVSASNPEVRDRGFAYLYAPEAGWASFTGSFDAQLRDVTLYLDAVPIHRWRVYGVTYINVPLLVSAGYHTVTVALEPPCPPIHDATLRCSSLWTADLSADDFVAAEPHPTIEFEQGVQLTGAYIPEQISRGEDLTLSLWWRFDEAVSENEVRFIHVFDEAGNLVTQMDGSLGNQPAGGQWSERLEIPLPDDLSGGIYTVDTGWYTYPAGNRLAVLSDVPGAENGTAYVGTFSVGNL